MREEKWVEQLCFGRSSLAALPKGWLPQLVFSDAGASSKGMNAVVLKNRAESGVIEGVVILQRLGLGTGILFAVCCNSHRKSVVFYSCTGLS